MLNLLEVSAGYDRNYILKDINLDIKRNEITAIIGPNGCGKTTFMHCIMGHMSNFKGSILLNDEDIRRMHPKERAKKIAFLPQVRNVPNITAEALVTHGRFPHMGFQRRLTQKDRDIVKYAMDYTDTYKYRNVNIEQLSGGERQRVYFAMTLAQDTELILLDEPTTYMDISHQKDFLNLVKSLKERGKTIVIILHDLSQALKYADTIVVMDKGRISFVGNPVYCIDSGVIEQVFKVKANQFYKEGKRYIVFD